MHIARRPAGLVPDTVLGFAACAANGPSWSPVSRGAGRARPSVFFSCLQPHQDD